MNPERSDLPSGWLWYWEESKISIKLEELHRHRDNRITGFITIECAAFAYPHIHESDFLITGVESKTRLAKRLEEEYPGFAWENKLVYVCHHARHLFKQGEPAEELWTTEDVPAQEYLLYPLLPKGLPTLVFGEGGAGKGFLALTLAILAQLGINENSLGLRVPSRMANVLYLDWEMTRQVHLRRLGMLRRGMELPHFAIGYRRCHLSLPDDIGQIKEAIHSMKADLVVVDSVGFACGGLGDLNTSEVSLAFASALRQIEATTLLIAHNAKAPGKERKTPFGSRYFSDNSRNIWELRQMEERPEDELIFALFHRKSNIDRKHQPFSFRYRFYPDKITVNKYASVSMEEFGENLTTQQRIHEMLQQAPMGLDELTEELGIAKGTIKVALHRLRQNNKVTKAGDKWGLISKEEYP